MGYIYDITVGDELLPSKEVPTQFGISKNPGPDGKYLVVHPKSKFTYKIDADDVVKLKEMSEGREDEMKSTIAEGMDWG